MIEITVPGDPVPKGRPRVTTRGGCARTYTPKKTRDYEDRIRAAAVAAMEGRAPTENPVIVELAAYFGVPKSWPKWKRDWIEGVDVEHTGRVDLDNIIKAALDAMNGVVFDDDAQVVVVKAAKYYGEPPSLEIICRETESPPIQALRRRT